LKTSLHSVLDDWVAVVPWETKSINMVLLGSDTKQVRLATISIAWLVLALLVGYLLFWGARPAPATLATLLVIAWVTVDAMWLHSRVGRLENTFRLSAAARELPHIDTGFDKEMAQLVATARGNLDRLPIARVLIVAESEKNQFEALRAKYHLLPHAGVVTDAETARNNLARAEALLYIPDQSRAGERAKGGLNPATVARQEVDPNLSEIVGSSFASLMWTEQASGSAQPQAEE
jgi:hypothetical protein